MNEISQIRRLPGCYPHAHHASSIASTPPPNPALELRRASLLLLYALAECRKYDFHSFCLLLGIKSRPRNGKVARLPQSTRDQINTMLDDGLPYRQIIQALKAAEPTCDLSEMNLSSWFHGGYQDWRIRDLLAHAPGTNSNQFKVPKAQNCACVPTSPAPLFHSGTAPLASAIALNCG